MVPSPAAANPVRSIRAPAPPTSGAGPGAYTAPHGTTGPAHIVATDIIAYDRPTRNSTPQPTPESTQQPTSSGSDASGGASRDYQAGQFRGQTTTPRLKRRDSLPPRAVQNGTDQARRAAPRTTQPDARPPDEPIAPDRLLCRPPWDCHQMRLAKTHTTRQPSHQDPQASAKPSNDHNTDRSSSGGPTGGSAPGSLTGHTTTTPPPAARTKRARRVKQSRPPQDQAPGRTHRMHHDSADPSCKD